MDSHDYNPNYDHCEDSRAADSVKKPNSSAQAVVRHAKTEAIEVWCPNHPEATIASARIGGKIIYHCTHRPSCTSEVLAHHFNPTGSASALPKQAKPRLENHESPAMESAGVAAAALKAELPPQPNPAVASLQPSPETQDTHFIARNAPKSAPLMPAPKPTGQVMQLRSPQAQNPNPAANRDWMARVPPHALDAEMGLLGGILLDANAMIETVRVLKADDFYHEHHRMIFAAMAKLHKAHTPIDVITLANALGGKAGLERIGGAGYLAELAGYVPTAAHAPIYTKLIRGMALKREIIANGQRVIDLAYDNVTPETLIGEVRRVFNGLSRGQQAAVLPWEDRTGAQIANNEYLARIPVVDKLFYSSAVSMITGGKHAVKSTLARWYAICVAKGWDFLGRAVTQGPILYIASEDETMAARQELIRLGWKNEDPLLFLSASRLGDEKPEAFLERLAAEIERHEAVLVVLDMLFGFVSISDEMSYAGTREALGRIQAVASKTGAHIIAIHHAPKPHHP